MEPNKELEKVLASKFLTPSKFALEIEKIVAEEKLTTSMRLFTIVNLMNLM